MTVDATISGHCLRVRPNISRNPLSLRAGQIARLDRCPIVAHAARNNGFGDK